MLKPALGDKRRQINKIEAYAEDGSWYAEALVRRIGASELFVKVLRVEMLDDTRDEDAQTDTYEVKWGSPSVRYRVVRRADGAVIKEGFADKDEAADRKSTRLNSSH